VAHRTDEKLVSAWTPEGFHASLAAVAEAAGVSQSDIIRAGIAKQLIGVAEPPEHEEGEGREASP